MEFCCFFELKASQTKLSPTVAQNKLNSHDNMINLFQRIGNTFQSDHNDICSSSNTFLQLTLHLSFTSSCKIFSCKPFELNSQFSSQLQPVMSLIKFFLLFPTIIKSICGLLPFPQGSSIGVSVFPISFICFSIELEQLAVINLSENLHQRAFAFAEDFVARLTSSSQFFCLNVVKVSTVFDRIVC